MDKVQKPSNSSDFINLFHDIIGASLIIQKQQKNEEVCHPRHNGAF
jgi:hypothetical protein